MAGGLPAPQVDDVLQAGALCTRRTKSGALRVLLVASRGPGRWGLPKGHIEPGETSRTAAEREAFEEAGVRGAAAEQAFGGFTYRKDGNARRFHVAVHLLETRSMARSYPEKTARRKRWFSIEEAAKEAHQTGLREVLYDLIRSGRLSSPEPG